MHYGPEGAFLGVVIAWGLFPVPLNPNEFKNFLDMINQEKNILT